MSEQESRAGHRPGASVGDPAGGRAEQAPGARRDRDRDPGLAGDLARAFAGPGGTPAGRARPGPDDEPLLDRAEALNLAAAPDAEIS
ncbi:hypothetical protein, partial [Pseudonocardia sp. McavD-2-B]